MYVKCIENFKIEYLYLLFLLVRISFSSKYQRRPLQEGELWQEISANVGEGTDPGIVGPDNIWFLRGGTLTLLNKKDTKLCLWNYMQIWIFI